METHRGGQMEGGGQGGEEEKGRQEEKEEDEGGVAPQGEDINNPWSLKYSY